MTDVTTGQEVIFHQNVGHDSLLTRKELEQQAITGSKIREFSSLRLENTELAEGYIGRGVTRQEI